MGIHDKKLRPEWSSLPQVIPVEAVREPRVLQRRRDAPLQIQLEPRLEVGQILLVDADLERSDARVLLRPRTLPEPLCLNLGNLWSWLGFQMKFRKKVGRPQN